MGLLLESAKAQEGCGSNLLVLRRDVDVTKVIQELLYIQGNPPVRQSAPRKV